MRVLRRKKLSPYQTTFKVVGAARAEKVARAVVEALSHYGRLGTGTKTLVTETHYKLRTIQRSLHRLSEIGQVIKTPAGWAVASVYHDLSADPTSLIGFQNLRFVVSNWRVTPMPPCFTARWRPIPGGDAGPSEGVELAWAGRRVTLRYYPEADTLDVKIAAVVPIPLDKAGELYGWLVAMLGLERGETTRTTYVEVNADHRTVRLEENYIELRDLPGVARVVYQKALALRHEIRLSTPVDDSGKTLPLKEALALLVEGSAEARYERLLKMEVDVATKALELARAATDGAAQARRDPVKVTPGDAAREGFG